MYQCQQVPAIFVIVTCESCLASQIFSIHFRRLFKAPFFLPAGNMVHLMVFAESCACRDGNCFSCPLGKGVGICPGVYPVDLFLCCVLHGQNGLLQAAGAFQVVYHGPAFSRPGHGVEGCFTPHHGQTFLLTAAKIEHHPASVRQLHGLPVTAALNIRMLLPLAQDGIKGAGDERTFQIAGTSHCFHMAVACAAFRHKEIVPAILIQHVRAFGGDACRSCVNHFRGTQHIAFIADFHHGDTGVGQHVSSSVHVSEQRRINAVNGQELRGTPGAFQLFRTGDHLQAEGFRRSAQGRRYPEASLEKGNVRCPVAHATRHIQQAARFQIIHSMADHLPMHQIPRVADGQPRKIREGGVHHVVILSHPQYGRIGMKAPCHRITVAVLDIKAYLFLQVRIGSLILGLGS